MAEIPGQVIYCQGNLAENLTTGLHDTRFVFEQAEADTMMLTGYNIIRVKGDVDDVIIDSEDSDVSVQAAYVSKKLPGNLLIKNKLALIKSKEDVSDEMAEVVIALYELTGSDGHGKKKAFEKAKKDPEARKLLVGVGENLVLESHVRENMKKFVLSILYGLNSELCSEARACKWKKMKKKSMARLPSDDDTLNHHCDRTNYLSYCLRHFYLRSHPSPIGHGFEIINGRCRPIRYKKSALPKNFSPIINTADMESENESGSEYGENSDAEGEEED